MLILTRKKDERIVLPEVGIEICVCEIMRDKVRIGVQAPKHIKVHRQEIWYKILAKRKRGELTSND